MTAGLYLVLEGGDGTGKSRQAEALVGWLRDAGHTVAHLREPGSTPAGEALRRLLLDPESGHLLPLTEALLFSAARAELLAREVRGALAEGRTVVAERCYLSTLVYQGVASPDPVPLALLREVTAAVHGDCWPDRIFLLDVDEPTRRTRADAAGKADRFERRDPEFHRSVRDAYLALAGDDPRVQVIDARGTVAAVQSELRRRVAALTGGDGR